MKRFRFRLEKILNYRDTVRKERLRDLSLRLAEVREAEDRLVWLEQEGLRVDLDGKNMLSSGEILLSSAYAKRIMDQTAIMKLEIMRLQDKVEEARIAYLEAAKEHKALVTLKAKKQEEYRQLVQREEDNSMDELMIIRGNKMEQS